MPGTDPIPMGSYELPLPQRLPLAGAIDLDDGESLSQPLLLANVRWFCRLRWLTVAILGGFGLLGMWGPLASRLGLHVRAIWPFVAAVALAGGNLAFHRRGRLLRLPAGPRAVRAHLWAQIVLDLIVLTAVVHFLGSARTYVPFTYLFHIVLACVFFPRRQSFLVTLLACVLFSSCVAAEHLGLLEASGMFVDSAALRDGGAVGLNALSAMLIWLVVWYLVSRLSRLVRERDLELTQTNRRLVEAQRERSRHMLITTHQLKAPFAAIHANATLLLEGHYGPLPPPAVEVVQRIAARCLRLAAEIQEMLQLANLSSASQRQLPSIELDLPSVLASCISQVQPIAQQRDIRFVEDLQPARVAAVEDHLRMIFTNLLSNAVVYSHPGGQVRVSCQAGPDGGASVTVSDDGIGIAPDKLPRIFDEHYRANEAVQHNKDSSGLGLAIVRHAVQLDGIGLRVDSRPGVGTTFQLRIPPRDAAPLRSAN